MSSPDRVLVVNAGSSSLKLTLVERGRAVGATTVERWAGEGDLAPVREFLDGCGRVDAVGHRVVHGGPRHSGPTHVTDEVIGYLDSIADLAPLHNPRAVAAMREVGGLLDVPSVACFDTAFHAELPLAARTYALPREWNDRWSLRRYGFHGLSHAYAVRRGAELVGAAPEDLRIVSCHLGAGASLAAVVGGRSVDTTMGFTPLEGLVMGTRSGSVDPGLLLWLVRRAGVDVDELASALENESGLRGLSGLSGDLRDVLAARDHDADAALAYDVFVHRLRREAAGMTVGTGGIDLLVLTGGIGQHSAVVRADLVAGLAHLGLAIDHAANEAAAGDTEVTAAGAIARTVVVAASEETEIARQTLELLG